MKSLNKALLAAAIFATTGAANAAINNIGSALDNASETYLSVYDSSQTLTFTLDLGVTVGTFYDNLASNTFSLDYDLSQNDMWNTFVSSFDPTTTVWAIAGSVPNKMFVTGLIAPTDAKLTTSKANSVATQIKTHANQITTGQVTDNPGPIGSAGNYDANNSSLVYDSDTKNTGQHLNFNSIFGQYQTGKTNIAYGESSQFWMLNTATTTQVSAGQWTLSGDLLHFGAPVANVPLPAAVWMFGAGLMGLLRATRRKYAAA